MSNILSKTSKYNGSTVYSENNTYNNLGSLSTSSVNLNGESINKSYTYSEFNIIDLIDRSSWTYSNLKNVKAGAVMSYGYLEDVGTDQNYGHVVVISKVEDTGSEIYFTISQGNVNYGSISLNKRVEAVSYIKDSSYKTKINIKIANPR